MLHLLVHHRSKFELSEAHNVKSGIGVSLAYKGQFAPVAMVRPVPASDYPYDAVHHLQRRGTDLRFAGLGIYSS